MIKLFYENRLREIFKEPVLINLFSNVGSFIFGKST